MEKLLLKRYKISFILTNVSYYQHDFQEHKSFLQNSAEARAFAPNLISKAEKKEEPNAGFFLAICFNINAANYSGNEKAENTSLKFVTLQSVFRNIVDNRLKNIF